MAKCTARFDGVARDPEAVEAFIDSVEVYKECACVSDDIALRGLPMLMEGEAAIWWRGVRNEVSSWPDALKRLRAMYGVPRPAHKVFRDVFSSEQGDELADSFIVEDTCYAVQICAVPEPTQGSQVRHKSIGQLYVYSFVNVNTFSDSHCNDKHSVSRPILHIGIQGYNGTALLDTAARRSIAGYTLYALFQRLGMKFRTENMSVRLADGTTRNTKILLTHADVELSSVCIPIEFIIFPDSQNNETLLGIDFILKARLIIDFSSMTWRSADQPRDIHPLTCENSRDPISCASINLLREDEGKFLSESEKGRLVDLLGEYTDVFEEVGEPTPFSEHRIDTGDHPPIAVPPYRVTPARKEVMRAELDKMLAEDVIEECESAWSAPCVLVPKPNGTYRFCVDYRKLNAVTKTD
ncbi:uncharacterized protein LOC114252393, partial [Bombyx mandarina]|uniref:Uncharacterized protein LOC114252393 n=1 Tax=Bombyx mandarina TaxID=7092 RepID=A0A6J2KMC1_BOMMA